MYQKKPSKMFGPHEVRYDVVIDHDTYNFLRVSLEVPRDSTTEAIVFLNGKEIGRIETHKKSSAAICEFKSKRLVKKGKGVSYKSIGTSKSLGQATASVITDFVTTSVT